MIYYPIKHANGRIDRRYKVHSIHMGHERPRFAALFCDDIIGHGPLKCDAIAIVRNHAEQRQAELTN